MVIAPGLQNINGPDLYSKVIEERVSDPARARMSVRRDVAEEIKIRSRAPRVSVHRAPTGVFRSLPRAFRRLTISFASIGS